MLDPMDYDDLLFFENLVDDSVIATTSCSQAFELAKQRFPESTWVLGDRS